MAIRIRKVNGLTVALCAAETDPKDGDVYLGDSEHLALAAKFCADWFGQTVDWKYPEYWAVMETQKVRDAKEELIKWLRLVKDTNERD